uniref:Uncharacterized protein n=1 Tax=Mycobacterium sp. (strain KMS) TaxID=189918 RepID=A1UIU7_MYCSK
MTEASAAEPWRPQLTVTYDHESIPYGVVLWVKDKNRPLPAPIYLTPDEALTLSDALVRAVTDHDGARTHLDEITDAKPDDFK